MVFELVSNVYERNSVEILTKSTKLYKSQQIDLVVENGFPTDVLFQIQILYERAGSTKKLTAEQIKAGAKGPGAKGAAAAKGGKDQKSMLAPGGKNGSSQPQTPEPFSCKHEHVKIRKNAQAPIPVIFLPFELGIHKCHVIFTDEAVGEVQYTIVGKAELPEILDTFTGDCNSEEPFSFKKALNIKNDRLVQAMQQMAEKEKKDGKAKGGREQPPSGDREEKKAPAKGPIEMPSKLFEIEISNPFFTGPQTITLYDPTV